MFSWVDMPGTSWNRGFLVPKKLRPGAMYVMSFHPRENGYAFLWGTQSYEHSIALNDDSPLDGFWIDPNTV